MGFRGCDERFAIALDYAGRHPKEFRKWVGDFLTMAKQREERIYANSEIFSEKYGIKYCPFHYSNLVENVIPNSIALNIDGFIYDFNNAVCSAWRLCETPISFDGKLIDKLAKENLREVKVDRSNSCTTCGEKRGKAYRVGFRSPKHIFNSTIKEHRESSNDIPVYLFDRSCSCGHSYVFMKSSSAPNLILKE